MLLLRSFRKLRDRSMVHPYGLPPPFTFIVHLGFDTQVLAQMLDSLVRVSRRAAWNHYASVLAVARSSAEVRSIAPEAITHPRRDATFLRALSDYLGRRWPVGGGVNRMNGRTTRVRSGSKRFPFNNFTCCLTLFSKCFSSFDHSTCALSVYRRYLALDEIYHPF